METQRFIDKEKKARSICTMAHYKERNGILISTQCEASWKLEKGDYPDAKFHLRPLNIIILKCSKTRGVGSTRPIARHQRSRQILF